YDDSLGVTAEFTLNALLHANVVAGLDFDLEAWKHVCEYDEEQATILAYAESTRDQSVRLVGTGEEVNYFARGDRILMERSRKFSPDLVQSLALASGLILTRTWSSDLYLVAELRPDLFREAASKARWLFNEVVGEEGMMEKPVPLRHPYAFYLGHIAAFTDVKLLQLAGEREATYRKHFERGIDPDVDDPTKCHSHSPLMDEWPSIQALQAYDDAVTAAATARVLARGYYSPEELGCDDQLFVWDNETPSHTVQTHPFTLSSLPITNAQFAEFVHAGGYACEPLWPDPVAARWARERSHPLRWCPNGGVEGWGVHLPLGGVAGWEVAKNWPAHVTLAEAQAYCEWLGEGARLMTESEYRRVFEFAGEVSEEGVANGEAAADACFLRSAWRGNNNFKFSGPTVVGTLDDAPASSLRVYDLVGNGWEWTSSTFEPFDGFSPMPSYPEYSADFFDGKHFVCLGASMFTSRCTIRPSFRNFYQDRYPHVIAKFRLAWS
ncbi:MAG: hypothetical protein SGPRY_012783, partial [Prymnesium sp.]